MDKKKINELKDKLYEAEGLLELLELRSDKEGDLLPMIKERIEEASRIIGGDCSDAHPDSECEPMPMDEDTLMIEEEAAQPVAGESARPEAGESARPVAESYPNQASEETPKSAPAFCLNDRFRFRRTIFGGSQEEFNNAMNLLTTFDSYQEAEEYFLGEMGLDPDDENVADFMTIIRNYFGA